MAKKYQPNGAVTDKHRAHLSATMLARFILQDADYRENLIMRARSGILAPNIEIMLWHYVLGKPADTLNINPNADAPERDLANMTDAELHQEVLSLRVKAEDLMRRKKLQEQN